MTQQGPLTQEVTQHEYWVSGSGQECTLPATQGQEAAKSIPKESLTREFDPGGLHEPVIPAAVMATGLPELLKALQAEG